MYIMNFSDHIHTVDAEETAKYVEPKGFVGKLWDWLSEYRSFTSANRGTCSSIFFPSVNTTRRGDVCRRV